MRQVPSPSFGWNLVSFCPRPQMGRWIFWPNPTMDLSQNRDLDPKMMASFWSPFKPRYKGYPKKKTLPGTEPLASSSGNSAHKACASRSTACRQSCRAQFGVQNAEIPTAPSVEETPMANGQKKVRLQTRPDFFWTGPSFRDRFPPKREPSPVTPSPALPALASSALSLPGSQRLGWLDTRLGRLVLFLLFF